MKSGFNLSRLAIRWLGLNRFHFAIILLLVASVTAGWFPSEALINSSRPLPMDTCATATAINPAALPFLDDSSTAGMGNDVDPGAGSCAPGPGADVVYRITPTVTDSYTIGATPGDVNFDLSLYVVTDCSIPAATCVAGANERAVGKSEFFTATLNAGTTYFIIVDGALLGSAGPFHFSIRRGAISNETCASPIVISASQLPFSTTGTTFDANNDFNPGTPCLRSNSTARGGDVVFQFTPSDTQTYVVRATPMANFDVSVYVVTNCNTLAGCSSSDGFGGGDPEEVRRPLTDGVTYFIIVDSFREDAGDFTLAVEPTIPIAPDAPTNLVATAIDSNRIDLQWMDNSDNEQGFRIERSLDGSNFQTLATTGPNTTTFSDTTVDPNTTYFYRVFAFNNFGSSAPSNIASATTPAPPPPPVPVIMVAPDMVDFGTVNVMATATVTVSNAGGANLVISAITGPNAPFSLVDPPALPVTIAPAQSIDLTVKFTPTAAALFTGSFTLSSNDPARPSVEVPLRGVGTAAPVPNLDFGSLLLNFPSGESVISIDVRNTGNADLLISSIRGPRAPFSASGAPPLPATIKAGEGFVMNIAFSPSAPGVFLGDITFLNNDPDNSVALLRLRGTSTPENEILKLKAPTLVTAVMGQTRTLNILATNGTNTNIQLSATSLAGATFTDQGSGRGQIAYTPPADATGTQRMTITARDTANRMKILQVLISIAEAASTHNVQIIFTPPETASNPPTGVLANDLSITPLGAEPLIEPQVAAGLIGYVIYRSTSPNPAPSLSSIVGVVGSSATSFTDIVPAEASSTQVFFYTATALYQTGTESAASNSTSNAPRMTGLQFKKKTVRFQAANSNVAVGAVLIVNGQQTFPLIHNGSFIQVDKNARSTPGNLRPRDTFTSGSSNRVQVRNPNGSVSAEQTLNR
ncbi:MAG: choice-of-anchor D domain-containing protein [Acidobacteriota bacterium]